MKKKAIKKYHYVAVLYGDKLKFVYSINNAAKCVKWKTLSALNKTKTQKPKTMTKGYAESLAQCLMINGFNAVVITRNFEGF